MPYAPPHAAPHVAESAPTSDGEAPAPPLAVVAAAGGALVALGAVVGGFVLVALALVGVGGASAAWGGGLCVGGWALAAVLRERARDGGAGA